MSATSPVIQLDARGVGHEGDVLIALRRLFRVRRRLQLSGRVTIVLAVAALLLCAAGIVDFVSPMPFQLRVALAVPIMLAAALTLIYALRMAVTREALSTMAREVERAAGLAENALVTFAEQVDGKAVPGTQTYIFGRLERQARTVLSKIDHRVVAPRGSAVRGISALALVFTLLLTVGLLAPSAFARQVRRIIWLERDLSVLNIDSGPANTVDENSAILIEHVRVRVIPPAYSGLGAEDASGEGPVRALSRSEIEVELLARGTISGASLGFGGTSNPMRSLGEGRYSGSFVAEASGAFESRLISDDDQAPAPLVRAVEVYPDAPPETHITEPAGDQLLKAVPAPLPVRWTARDDLGLADVTLKYIKSRGDGDAAVFTSGIVPPGIIERVSVREWRGVAMLDLARLGMRAGDTIVYWTESRDRNTYTNNTGRSASLAIAIAQPEPVKLNLGDLGPNEIGRFLLSQRMIIIHTEKLHRERARLARADLHKRAQDIASEQRDFKNSFNDYIKIEGVSGEAGHDHTRESDQSNEAAEIEERVREAEDERTGVHMHGIPEPPSGAPSNVRDMVYAIRAMWDAEEALSVADTARALTHEREALTRLKRAQLAVRYIPPIVASSKPVDLKRRYAGELNEIKTRLEKLSRRAVTSEAAPLRAALSEAYAALAELQATLDVPATARASATARAREKTKAAADRLVVVAGNHAATIAEAAGQLRLVETELSRLDLGGTSDQYAARLSKPLALLTQASANLFAIVEAGTRALSGEANSALPADDARAAEYFRRLNK